GEVVALVDAWLGRRVARGRDDRRAAGAVRVAGEFLVAPGDVAALEQQLRAVGERVLDRVGVEVLIDVLAAIIAAARPRRTHGKRVLHPGALVNVVNQEVAERPAAGPQERMEALDLVE